MQFAETQRLYFLLLISEVRPETFHFNLIGLGLCITDQVASQNLMTPLSPGSFVSVVDSCADQLLFEDVPILRHLDM